MRKTIVGKKRLQQIAKVEAEKLLKFTSSTDINRTKAPANCVPVFPSLSNEQEETVNFNFECEFSSSEESESEIVKSSDKNSIRSFVYSLREWALNENVNHKQFSSLLKCLKTHECFSDLPSDSRSVLTKPNCPPVLTIEPGEYIHFGLENSLKEIQGIETEPVLNLQINVDGLPLFKSSNIQFWPILCNVVDITLEPIVLGVYCGSKKPNQANEFLKPFIDEFIVLQQKYETLNVKLRIHSFVCDTPARAYIKSVKGHTGYQGCDKCSIEGDYVSNRVVFIGTGNHRTNASFRSHQDDDHHLQTSILECVRDLDMVADFPLDYMHSICLGVMRKILHIWLKGKPGPHKLSSAKISQLNERLLSARSQISSDFPRKPRSLQDIERWKATEFRQFLLYTGPVVVQNIISSDSLKLFLSLSVAVRILCSETLGKKLNSYAQELLKYFVYGFETLYGRELVSYNIHSLLHIGNDSLRFGKLDNFSAFQFENKLGKIKKLVRTPNKPLQQFAARLLELRCIEQPHRNRQKSILLGKEHTQGPTPANFNGKQYISVKANNFVINIKQLSDSFVLSRSGDLVQVQNILSNLKEDQPLVYVTTCKNKRPLFCDPCDSQTVNIFLCDKPDSSNQLILQKLDTILEITDEVEKSVEVVPDTWYNKHSKMCQWPPVKNATSWIKSRKAPTKTWGHYPARILHQYDRYEDARRSLKKAEDTSDLNTDSEVDETPRRKKRVAAKRLQYDDADVSDDESDNPEVSRLVLSASSLKPSSLELMPPPPPPVVTSDIISDDQVDETIEKLITNSEEGIQTQGVQERGSLHEEIAGTSSVISLDLSQIANCLPTSETNELLTKLLSEISIVKQYVINMDKKIDQLAKIKQSNVDFDAVKRIPIPFKTVDDFVTYEESMEEQDEKDLKHLILISGGNSTIEFVGRALKKLFIEEVATRYSLKGQKGNLNFSGTKTWKILLDCALSIRNHDADEKKVEKAVSEWFRHANERLKKKNATVLVN